MSLIKGKCNFERIFIACWLFVISLLTVNKYAPQFLNADVILNSVMSLQNITLYYWGQNRLLNILPLLVSHIRSPLANLFAVMFIAAVIFYSFILIMVIIVNKSTNNNEEFDTLKLFIAISCLFVFLFKEYAIFDIAIGHVEYSLSALLVAAALYLMWFCNIRQIIYALILTAVLLTIGIGLNPSILIVALFTIIIRIFHTRKLQNKDVLLAAILILIFLVWHGIARIFGDYSYGDVSYGFSKLSDSSSAINTVFVNIISSLNIQFLLIIFMVIAFHRCYQRTENREQRTEFPEYRHIALAICLFSVSWIFVFSSNTWVRLNAYHWRYFTFVFFSWLLILGYELQSIFKMLPKTKKLLVFILIFAVGLSITLEKPVFFKDYVIFKKINTLTSELREPYKLYAGDYWIVWPMVFHDLASGKPSFGLTFRGTGNRDNVVNFITNRVAEHGFFLIHCLQDTISSCITQVKIIMPTSSFGRIISINEGVTELEFFLIDLSKITKADHPYSENDLRNISLSYVSIENIASGKKNVKIKISNANDFPIAAQSQFPIRLSWRFLDASGTPVTGWDDTRWDLPYDIPEKGDLVTVIPIEQNDEFNDMLQISLVQELVFWWHDLGMQPLNISLN
jgi:hypothetical protein